MFRCPLVGESHLAKFKTDKESFGFHYIKSHSGLSVMPTYFDRYSLTKTSKPRGKIVQTEEVKRDIASCDSAMLSVSFLSNDWKNFITVPVSFLVEWIPLRAGVNTITAVFGEYGKIGSVTVLPQQQLRCHIKPQFYKAIVYYKYFKQVDFEAAEADMLICGQKIRVTEHGREMIRLSEEFCQEWRSMEDEDRRKFDVQKEGRRIVSRHHRDHLLHQLEVYSKVLQGMLGPSEVRYVLHWSILERLHNDYPQLDVLFGVLNSYLRSNLDHWSRKGSIRNCHGNAIKFTMVDLQPVFWNFKVQEEIFCPNERKTRGEKVHRITGAMHQAIDMAREALTQFKIKL